MVNKMCIRDRIRGGKGGIHNQGNAVGVSNLRHLFDINQCGVGVTDGFNEDSPGTVIDGAFKGARLIGVDEMGGDAVLRQGMGQQVVGAAVDGLG